MRYLRYLRRRPAALKMVSSETGGSPWSLSFSPTCPSNCLFGKAAWSGGPSGYSSSMARFARSKFGRPFVFACFVQRSVLGVPSCSRGAHKTLAMSVLESSIQSRFQEPGRSIFSAFD